MGTKNISAVLREFGEQFDEEDPPLRLRKARMELREIREAARILQSVPVPAEHPNRDALNAACFLMETIAEEFSNE